MNILMIINSFFPLVGGAERQAQRISETLIEKGHSVTVLTRHHKGLKDNENINGINIIRLKVGNVNKVKPIIFLIKCLKYVKKNQEMIDIVHGHSLNAPGLIVALIKKYFKIPVIVKIAGGGDKSGCEIIKMNNAGLKGKLKVKLMLKHIDKFLAISKTIEKDLIKVGADKRKIHYLPNGIDLKLFKNSVSNTQNNFLYLGRLENVKGIDILINAWTALIKENKNFPHKLFIAGSGSLENIIPQNSTIEYLGNVEDVKSLIMKNKFFLLPSRYEGISNALLEAMALERIIIASNVGGNPDLIENNVSGYLFESENELELKKIIKEVSLLKNVNDMGGNARNFLDENYDLNKNVNKIIDLYKSLIK
ncbi:glycosyltransferase involved in cell wall biosynthesis [Planomicrobium koreense]|uniref:Glycosyltransferase involved in cell wall biosynthesis n=1 Tax=Planococcus koreensis TaxID=112331 RepID=A0A7W8CR74_9BACL|nr:glycosyltransferase family 4 protein [Planococcus koreensis]MBB5179384.1 glycosyltransferase involved in cell wall biosynthesis [Planococcus koreensis]